MPENVNNDNTHVSLRRHLHASGLGIYPGAESVLAKHFARYVKGGTNPGIALRFAIASARLELEGRD